jgi:hypothetical protein
VCAWFAILAFFPGFRSKPARPGQARCYHARACLVLPATIMRSKGDLSHLLLMKLREMSFEGHPVSIPPNDKRIEIAGFSANDVENCFAGLVEEGLLEQGSTVDDDGNLVFTGLSTSGHDTVGAIRNQELPDEN